TQAAPSEFGREELAQPRVVGRVSRPESSDGINAGSLSLAYQRADVVTEPMMIRQDRTGFLVAGNEPHVPAEHPGEPGDRSLSSPPAELGDRVEPITLQRHHHRAASQAGQTNFRHHQTRELPSDPTLDNGYGQHHKDPPQ